MPDEAQDRLGAGVRGRSSVPGDVPDHLKRRYFTQTHGDEVGFYVDARIEVSAFRDRGRALVASRPDPNAIRDMVAIAGHRGWTMVDVKGSKAFRREAWLAARAAGLEVRGYRPTERDLQDLQRRQDRQVHRVERDRLEGERRPDRRDRAADAEGERRMSREDGAARARLRVVEAVVADRVRDPDRQREILGAARERLARWLERGARLQPLSIPERARQERRAERDR